MAAQKSESPINLLPQEEFAASTLGRVLIWLLSTFRIIVIVTEMVVMIAFLSRFWLDARSNDLNDLIKQKVAVLSATSDFEKEFRNTQKKLKIFSVLAADEKPISSLLEKISSFLPADVSLTSFAFNEDSAQVGGVSASEQSIAQFLVNLNQSKEFEKVSLENVSSSSEDKTLIKFVAKVVPGKPKGGK